VLKALQVIHSHKVTHYDIKCDNIFIDFKSGGSQSALSRWGGEDDKMRITVGDFGECRIFLNEQDEYCSRSRGTECIKSPEMLQLNFHTRKDTDKYDRRKKVGTNRLSDVWSAGCLLFELLTGEYLFFFGDDYVHFFLRVTDPKEQLLTDDKLELIGKNVYLIDFLKYMLVRDTRLRPTIDNVLKRFEHVHALLVSTSSANSRFNVPSPSVSSIRGQ